MITDYVKDHLWSPGKGMGLFTDRKPQRTGAKIPDGTVVVSADNHYSLTEDIFYNKFPEHLREGALRIEWDEGLRLFQHSLGGRALFNDAVAPLMRSMEDHEGARDLKARMLDLSAEGIDKEIAYPQVLNAFFSLQDREARGHLYSIYNEYIAEQQSREPERFFPVAIGNYWDPSVGAAWVRHIKSLGLKTLMLPLEPGTKNDGAKIYYSSREYDDMWAAIEESGMPISFHVGESLAVEGPAGSAPLFLSHLGSSAFRKILGELIFGGVFDRFPGLKVIFAEANINWIPGAIQDAEMMFNSHALLYSSRPNHSPEYYWRTNCYATIIIDMIGLEMLPFIGADRVMWSSDYPHNEGTFGYSRDSMQALIDVAPSEELARSMLGGLAVKLYNL